MCAKVIISVLVCEECALYSGTVSIEVEMVGLVGVDAVDDRVL